MDFRNGVDRYIPAQLNRAVPGCFLLRSRVAAHVRLVR